MENQSNLVLINEDPDNNANADQLSDQLNSQLKLKDLDKKRDDYLEWSEYFMAVAFLSAMRSKDPCSQVGACIVNSENRIVGVGYNGMPIGCSDDLLPWSKSAKTKIDTKYMYGKYIIHFLAMSLYFSVLHNAT